MPKPPYSTLEAAHYQYLTARFGGRALDERERQQWDEIRRALFGRPVDQRDDGADGSTGPQRA